MNATPIVPPQEWEAARQELLVKEKELTGARDALAADRRRMPRMAVEKDYRFEGPRGPVRLVDPSARGRRAVASRAPQPDIERLKARMGWDVPWYTITDDFDVDFGVDEWHGTNAFVREGDEVSRTYFVNHRGDEALGSTWSYLDLSALGRQEAWEDSPEGHPQSPAYAWWRRHDEYEADLDPWGDSLDERVAALRAHARAAAGTDGSGSSS